MCHLIFLKSFSLLFPGEAVNVGLIYSENEPRDYPVPHLANGFPFKGIPALLPTPCSCWAAGEAHVGSWRKVFKQIPHL